MAEEEYRGFTADTPLPDMGLAMQLWDTYAMLDNIRRHSEVVCAVALLLTDWLMEAGYELNRRAVEMGALLHDLAKTQCLGSKRRHDDEGADILAELGYDSLAFLVRHHVVLPPGATLDETMIVNYADKRVNHDQVVNLNQRFAYIASRYGLEDPERLERIEEGRQRAVEVERVIFSSMFHMHTPDEVLRRWREKNCIRECQ